ncbi:hypothetical protein R1sor_008210 [Riccia sorocarpa]|uniref:Uncharacterized protein n=1 Tax=Riccia sorocarpa TaxID=122646 RepID=A0ABD3HW62_9MARC
MVIERSRKIGNPENEKSLISDNVAIGVNSSNYKLYLEGLRSRAKERRVQRAMASMIMMSSNTTLHASPLRPLASIHGSSSRLFPPPSARATQLRSPSTIQVPGGVGRARITCWNDRREEARKALDNALGNKKETFEKWNEEIKKREAGGGGPKGRGRGWGGGGGGGGGGSGNGRGGDSDQGSTGNENKGEEALQFVYAFGGLTALYLILTQGQAMAAFLMNSVLWVSRGFKRPAPRRPVLSGAAGGSAADEVKRKWGSED